jgi:hypothetical protein
MNRAHAIGIKRKGFKAAYGKVNFNGHALGLRSSIRFADASSQLTEELWGAQHLIFQNIRYNKRA